MLGAIHIFYFSLLYRDLTGLSATVLSTLPAGAGLGSSAAYSVCLAAGFLSSCGKIPATGGGTEECDGGIQKGLIDRIKKSGIELTMKCASSEEGWNREHLALINEWGLKAEKLIHGTPSGIDNTISTYGIHILYNL